MLGELLDGEVRRTDRRTSRTPAEWYCLLVGLGLMAAGAVGFLVNDSFGEATLNLDLNDGEHINGDLLLGLEVNGWHNIVHLVSGLVLLVATVSRAIAKATALTFAFVYGLVTIVGAVDGNDVLGVIPVNAADNLLHSAIAVVAVVAALISPPLRSGS